jgi:hypothetical protein
VSIVHVVVAELIRKPYIQCMQLPEGMVISKFLCNRIVVFVGATLFVAKLWDEDGMSYARM